MDKAYCPYAHRKVHFYSIANFLAPSIATKCVIPRIHEIAIGRARVSKVDCGNYLVGAYPALARECGALVATQAAPIWDEQLITRSHIGILLGMWL